MSPRIVRSSVFLLAIVGSSVAADRAPARVDGGNPVALVTAESENEIVAVSLPAGRILRRIRLPADPENVDVGATGPAVVVSARAGAVSILAWRSLRVVRVLRGFRDPHLAAIAPDGKWAYITDDGSGLVSVIRLAPAKIVARVFVGIGAHHLAFSPDQKRLWIALGERARTIVVLDTSRIDRPRVVARFEPGFPAHDLAFSPNGRRVWITSEAGDRITAFDERSRRPLFSVAVGPPPQHVAFGVRGFAYATSGYGRRIVMIDPRRGRIVRSARAPYGSFNVTSSGGLVVTSSLLRGTLTAFDDRLRLLGSVGVAPAARDAGVSVW